MNEPFNQPAPQLGNQYLDDRLLRGYLRRVLPQNIAADITPELERMGELAGGVLYRTQLADRLNEPRHLPWDAWGNRIDQIEVTRLWCEAEKLAAEAGLVAAAYEQSHGRYSRLHQFALAYLFTPSTDLFSCPLAMTDGAAKVLSVANNKALAERAMPHLTSRDPAQFWTSGQWMTESTGGSDVGSSETVARQEGGKWRLYGRKWFTSAVTSQMALTLARPEGNPPGGRGLALFYLETHAGGEALNNIVVHRLKDKLGTRKVPTAELTLDGALAVPVYGLDNGVRNIAPMLNITRTWNAVSAVSYMRRGLALAADYAVRRAAFGSALSDKPLHMQTLADIQAEFEAGFHLAFALVELLGREESGDADESQRNLLRLLTPIVKLVTGKQSVAVLSEVIESFGGAGYVEDTGLPSLLRDAQVFPIWEGTTNVLALDALKVMSDRLILEALEVEAATLASALRAPELLECARLAQSALANVARYLSQTEAQRLEGRARAIALSVGRAFALLLMARHAQWMIDQDGDHGPRHAAQIFCQHGIDLLGADVDPALARGLFKAMLPE